MPTSLVKIRLALMTEEAIQGISADVWVMSSMMSRVYETHTLWHEMRHEDMILYDRTGDTRYIRHMLYLNAKLGEIEEEWSQRQARGSQAHHSTSMHARTHALTHTRAHTHTYAYISLLIFTTDIYVCSNCTHTHAHTLPNGYQQIGQWMTRVFADAVKLYYF